MSRSNTAVFGIFTDEAAISHVIDELRAHGFRAADISALHPENVGSKDFGHELSSKAPEAAAGGGGLGAILGAGAGYLLSIGLVAAPGMEQFAAAGPVLASLSGMGAGMLAGGLLGGIAGSTIPEYEAKRYEGRRRRSGILMSVHCDNPDWTKAARNIMKRCGGLHISSATEARADFAKGPKPLPRSRVSHSA